MSTYIIREWIGDHREMNTVCLHTPLSVRISLEEVFGVKPLTEMQYDSLMILNIGSTITTAGKRGDEVITNISITRIE